MAVQEQWLHVNLVYHSPTRVHKSLEVTLLFTARSSVILPQDPEDSMAYGVQIYFYIKIYNSMPCQMMFLLIILSFPGFKTLWPSLLYTSDAADE